MPGLLRICTAGSVDDGKSTLIGRLLYDSQAVYEDQVKSVAGGDPQQDRRTDRFLALHRRAARRARAGHHDRRRLPLLRDRAAQVHPRRHARARAVHAQHGDRRVDRRRRHPARRRPARRARSRRGATRASRTCSASRASSWPSTRWTCSTSIAACSTRICDDFAGLAGEATVTPIPMSALHGDNVTVPSDRTPWFTGPEPARVSRDRRRRASARGPRRSGCRCSSSSGPIRSFAATPARLPRARFAPATRVTAWPSGWTSTGRAHRDLGRRSRRRAGADVGHARARGRARHQPRRRARGRTDPASTAASSANVVWMDERPLDPGRVYLLKHNTRVATAEVDRAAGAERDRHADRDRVAAARLRSLRRESHDRQLRADRSGDELHRRSRDDPAPRCRRGRRRRRRDPRPSGWRCAARAAATDAEAVEAVRRLLEEVLT